MFESKAPLVILIAGGTGGHVYPALALAEEIKNRGLAIAWIGTDRGLETEVARQAQIPFFQLPTRGFRGKSLAMKVVSIIQMFRALFHSIFLVWRLRPSCVVGMGGYASVPGSVAAWLLRKPLLIHEQNAVAGTANRFLAPFASAVVSGFPDAFKYDSNVAVLGNPIRASLLESSKLNSFKYTAGRKLRLLILGGSLGAKKLNEISVGTITGFTDTEQDRLEVWHQCGSEHVDEVRRAYGNLERIEIRLSPFITDMAQAYIWCDLVLCRAGALTVAELAIMKCPALLVPLPNAIDDHQNSNGSILAKCGAAKILNQSELTESALRTLLVALMDDSAILRDMSQAAVAVAKPLAARDICNLCLEIMNNG